MADALPRERWILTAGILFVVLGGLFPNAIVALQSAEAKAVEHAIYSPVDSDRACGSANCPSSPDPMARRGSEAVQPFIADSRATFRSAHDSSSHRDFDR